MFSNPSPNLKGEDKREVESELHMRWRRLMNSVDGMGNLMADKIHSRPLATQVAAMDVMLRDVCELETAALRYREILRKEGYGGKK